MIKGIMALFTSGVIFNPMVLLGVIFGIIFDIKMDYQQMMSQVYKNYHFYLLALILAAVYNILFKKTYKTGGQVLDIPVMFGHTISSALKFVAASAFTIIFIDMLSF